PHHHRLRAPRPPAALDEERRRSEPGDGSHRSRPPGLRRQRHLGKHLAGRGSPPGPSGGPGRLGPTGNAPHRSVTPRRRDPKRSISLLSGPSAAEIAERVLRGNWVEGERRGVRFAYTRPSPT